MRLSEGAEWILNFVQEIAGVRADPEGSWSTKHILFLSFLVCDADWSYLKKLQKMFWPWDCVYGLNGS